MNLTFRKSFWREFHAAPVRIQDDAEGALDKFLEDKTYPSLHFKKVGKGWSLRVNYRWRILLQQTDDGYEVLHLADHDEYEHLIKQWH
jgi:hypothetical protein